MILFHLSRRDQVLLLVKQRSLPSENSTGTHGLFYHLPKHFENSGWNVNGMAILVFPTGPVFSPVPSPTPILMRVTCYLVGVVQMVHSNPERNFSLGIFAYHLYKLSTNRFSHVNGKQP